MKIIFAMVAVWLVVSVSAQEVKNTSYATADGMRILRHELIVDAPRDDVWKAFTTSEGWISWAVPVAFIDFRLGGTIETSYNPEAKLGDPANIRHEIISYMPGEMISLRVMQTPPQFPFRELIDGMWAVFTFENVGEGKTRIISSGAGYLEGEGYDTLYGFFESGNAVSLLQLNTVLREGPVDWNEKLEAVTQHEQAGAASTEKK